ncbi:MAG: type VII secretion integral membrane protein EccD [Pseudonocardiaceae bacterium]
MPAGLPRAGPPDPSGPREPGGVEFRRISVAGPRTRVDVAVPAAVPLARLLPTFLRQVGEDRAPDGGVGHGGWVLSRDDGTRIDGTITLAVAGVGQGELLFLRRFHEAAPPPLFDDVVEVIGHQGVRVGWGTAQTRWAAAAVAAVAIGTAVSAAASAPGRLPGYLCLALAVILLLCAGGLARAFGDLAGATLTLGLAAPTAAVGAMVLLGTGDGLLAVFSPGHLLLACGVVIAMGSLGPTVIGGGEAFCAALIVAGLLGALGSLLVIIWEVDRVRAAAVVAAVALALTTLVPQIALRIARVPVPRVVSSAADLDEIPGQLALDRVQDQVVQARRMLTGLLVGCYLTVVVGTVLLLSAARLWPAVLAGVLLALALLRARLFRDRTQVWVPVSAVLVMLAGGGWSAVTASSGTGGLPGVVATGALVLAVISAAVGLISGRYQRNPRLDRLLDIAETALLLATVPLILAVWEVYTQLLNLRA